jgi:hypothetical protein
MINKYKERCNNPEERRKWEISPLRRLAGLRHNEKFECIDGSLWKKICVSKSGTILAVPAHATAPYRNEQYEHFISSALVRPLSIEVQGKLK